MFLVFVIIAFEPVAGISLNYEESTCDWQSTRYERDLRFQIWLREMFPNSTSVALNEN